MQFCEHLNEIEAALRRLQNEEAARRAEWRTEYERLRAEGWIVFRSGDHWVMCRKAEEANDGD